MAVSIPLASCGVQFHVAPLQCYTNQHLRALLRPLCPSAVLWTEMEKAEGLQRPSAVDLRSLRPDDERGPLVLQLGGGGATQLASAVRATAGLGFDEINLNAGCPSVETGGASYGARSRHLRTRRHPSLSPGDQPRPSRPSRRALCSTATARARSPRRWRRRMAAPSRSSAASPPGRLFSPVWAIGGERLAPVQDMSVTRPGCVPQVGECRRPPSRSSRSTLTRSPTREPSRTSSFTRVPPSSAASALPRTDRCLAPALVGTMNGNEDTSTEAL